MPSAKKPVGLDLSPEKKEFVLKALDRGISPTVISRSFQRQFGTVLPPQAIVTLQGSLLTPEKLKQRQDVDEIRSKLPSHERGLEFARALLEERMRDPDVSNIELVQLAREYRTNITSSQQMASMVDTKGDVQFVLVYGDTVEQASPRANVIDAEQFVLEDSDA